MSVVAARYFDGRSSRLHRVTLTVEDGHAVLRGDAERREPLHALHVSERSRHAARKVSFADGAYLEVDDGAAFAALLRQTGHRDGLVVRLQHSWRAVLAAAAATVATLWLGYLYLLPALAAGIAAALPPQVERQLGAGVLKLLDDRVLAPSTLSAQRQAALRERFRRLQPPLGAAPDWRLQFRSSRVGPNAFALPSGDIVMTDQLVKLLDSDAAVMAVLAHELGHLHQHHGMRRMIQGSIVTAVSGLVFGDMSALMATAPALLLDMKYSRDAEREADDYAVAMMLHNGLGVQPLVEVFARFQQLEREEGGDMGYLSSHPPSAERLERIRAAGVRMR
ncbi:putative Zn-dependent protease [Duganella sp. SG902]|uniref:M48 family metallopeptidase n=1 Tax=Duganella sp. SG902 TaxID=2587016 RepID=UPI00159DB69E|nr:M48 family metallopeptidase [Duganella sp. SG902]NVM74933.1 putative Zn-dependent protease [Duganella sp. SG902]